MDTSTGLKTAAQAGKPLAASWQDASDPSRPLPTPSRRPALTTPPPGAFTTGTVPTATRPACKAPPAGRGIPEGAPPPSWRSAPANPMPKRCADPARVVAAPRPTVRPRARLPAAETAPSPALRAAAAVAASERTLTTPPATHGRSVACMQGGSEEHRNSAMRGAESWQHDTMKPRRPFSNAPFSISGPMSSSVCSMGSWLAATKTASTRTVGVNGASGAHDTGCSSREKRAHAPGGHPHPLSVDPLESDTTCTSSNVEVFTPLPSRLPDSATGVRPRGERSEGEL